MSKLYVSIMMVALLALVCTGAFAVTTTWDVQSPEGTPVADNWVQEIPITAQVKCYIQILYQDNEIHFVNTLDDWYLARADAETDSTPKAGKAYGTATTSSCDAWADGWYESDDGAHLYIQTNNPVTMDIHRNGNLKTTAGDVIPTRWLMSAVGVYTKGFLMGGSWVNDGKVPQDGQGGYLGTVATTAGGDVFLGGQPFHPYQQSFSCEPASTHNFLKLPCPTRGTLQFKARMLRTSIAWGETGELIPDQAGDYTTSLDVTFTSP